MVKYYIKMARLDHWIKQLFIIPGMIIAIFLVKNIYLDHDLFFSIIIGFFSACLTASANYVINEYLDAKTDQFHPTKKDRPMIKMKLSKSVIYIEYALFSILGLILASFVSKMFFLTDFIFLITALLYNIKPIRLKDIVYLDVLFESVNSALRILLGWFIITNQYLPPVSIILSFWMIGAFLMGMKRYAEYRMFKDKTKASLYRKSFKIYSEKTLLISSIFYALLSIFSSTIFMIKYKIELLLCIPFLCLLFCYYLYLSFKPDSAVQKPEKLYQEKILMILLIGLIVFFLLLLFVNIPFLDQLLEGELIEL